MLCASNPLSFVTPKFRTEKNAYRGRFRRVVTIGSPQNGSRLEYYVSKVNSNIPIGGPANDAVGVSPRLC